MPKNLFQKVIFTLMMSFLMVYVMICYNISLNIGGMSNKVFLMAFGEMKIMWPVAFLLEFFIVDKLAHALAFRMVTPNDRPIVITLAFSHDHLHYVSSHESDCNCTFQKCWFKHYFDMVPDHVFQFSCCIFLADVLLRTMYPFYLWKNVFK